MSGCGLGGKVVGCGGGPEDMCSLWSQNKDARDEDARDGDARNEDARNEDARDEDARNEDAGGGM